MKLFLYLPLVIVMLLPAAVSAQVACRCNVAIEGSLACSLTTMTIEVPAEGGATPYTFEGSDIPLGAIPAQVPSCTGFAQAQFGSFPIQLEANACNTSYTGSLDVPYSNGQQQSFFVATISGCTTIQSRTDEHDVKLVNPLSTDNPSEIIATVIRAALGIIGSLTLIAFVAGGLMWVVSAGNAERVKRGLNTMLYAGIGLAVIFTAYAVLQLLLGGLGAA